MNDLMAETRINVRTKPDIKRDLEITARLRGLSVSALVNSLVVKAIREEKNIEPEMFAKSRKPTGIPKYEQNANNISKTHQIPVLREKAGDVRK